MPNFKKDKSKFTMKNMNYYKGKHAEGEANSPYNKNKSTAYKAGKSTAKSLASMAEQLATGQISRNLGRMFGSASAAHEMQHDVMSGKKKYKVSNKLRKDHTEKFIPNKDLKLRKDLEMKTIPRAKTMRKGLTEKFIPKDPGYVPQTKSRKDPSTDITPQTQKGKKMYLAKEERKVRKSAGWPKYVPGKQGPVKRSK